MCQHLQLNYHSAILDTNSFVATQKFMALKWSNGCLLLRFKLCFQSYRSRNFGWWSHVIDASFSSHDLSLNLTIAHFLLDVSSGTAALNAVRYAPRNTLPGFPRISEERQSVYQCFTSTLPWHLAPKENCLSSLLSTNVATFKRWNR